MANKDKPAITAGADGTALLSGALTFGTVPGLFDDWKRVAHECARADLQQVSAVDSAGLALLLEWSAWLRDDGAALSVINAPAGLLSLARLCDAGEWLSITGRENP